MKYFILVISACIACATNDHLDSKDSDDVYLVSERINPLLRHADSNDTCSGKMRATCRDQGGTCVHEPFDVNCSKGRIKPKGCRSKHCACCLPEVPRACDLKIKKECSIRYGTCVTAPFKQNCKNGTLAKKWCKGKFCQCCVPDTTPPPPTVCPPSPPPMTCPPVRPPVACPKPVTCPPTPPPVTCPPIPSVTCPPQITCPSQITCPPSPAPVTCPPPAPTPTCPIAKETEICPELPKHYIDWTNCTVLLESPTEEIIDLDESYYLSRNFVYQNGHLILKPKLGEMFNWLASIKHCQDLNSEPFIPKSQEDWAMLQEISENINDTTSKYNMWLPASDRGVEGLLKWLPVDVANDDPLIPWNRCTKMKTNDKPRDCLQLWSGNGYRATMDNCFNYETPHHYYPMVCQATFNGVNESYYLSNNFTYENGNLVLKPVFGQYMTWIESIERCRYLKSEPFVPRTESDWEWLRIVSSKIDDPLPHNLWLPASDKNVEGNLKWLPTADNTYDPLIPWAKGKVMRMNNDFKDCLQLWSGNGHLASMDECDAVNTSNHYYPMVCKATFRSITTKL